MIPNTTYNTGYNTLGVGNATPPKKACLTSSDLDNDRYNGSGDLFPILGESPTAYWCLDWKDKREEFLKNYDESKVYGLSEERPTLVFSKEPLPNENNYKPILGGKPSVGGGLY